MKEKLLHTPEGVRDIYNSECERKNQVVMHIHRVLELYNYHDIETPTFEYFNIFNMDKGSAPSNEMYKFFDRNNNTLVLRPDITPSIARCAAKYFPEEELPIRLCYKGNTFTNAPLHQGKLAEATQIGCELINDDSSAADAELIACVIDCLKASGLEEFQIEIGEIEYFKGIMEEAGIDSETELKLKDYIQLKNFFGLQEYVKTLSLSDNLKEALMNFDKLFGGLEMLDKASAYTQNPMALSAIDRMRKVYAALSCYGYESYISFDLGMLNRYNYYTGIVFRGYTYGTGDAVIKGGRYNNLLSQFGKNAPSVGFAIFVDELMMALQRQHKEFSNQRNGALVLYQIEHQESAISLGNKLRASGTRTDLIRKSSRHELDEYLSYAEHENMEQLYFFVDENTVRCISLSDRSERTMHYDEC